MFIDRDQTSEKNIPLKMFKYFIVHIWDRTQQIFILKK